MTVWEDYLVYRCRFLGCRDNCINHIDALVTHLRVCRDCHRTRDTDHLSKDTEHLPEHLTTSEAKGAPARPGAQRSEHPGPERERQSRSAPERPAGSDPSRVDPEGRAHPPNPEGDGGNENGVTRATDSTTQPR